jgi:hypothetical protein
VKPPVGYLRVVPPAVDSFPSVVLPEIWLFETASWPPELTTPPPLEYASFPWMSEPVMVRLLVGVAPAVAALRAPPEPVAWLSVITTLESVNALWKAMIAPPELPEYLKWGDGTGTYLDETPEVPPDKVRPEIDAVTPVGVVPVVPN